MKKVLTILLFLVICASIFAVDVSFGGFFAKEAEPSILDGNLTSGGFVSLTYQPWKLGKAEFGLKGDFIVGSKSSEHISLLGAVKAVAGFDFERISLLGGVGVTANGINSGKIALATEVSVALNIYENWSLGASYDCALGVRDFSFNEGLIEPVKVPLIQGAKVFVSYAY